MSTAETGFRERKSATLLSCPGVWEMVNMYSNISCCKSIERFGVNSAKFFKRLVIAKEKEMISAKVCIKGRDPKNATLKF